MSCESKLIRDLMDIHPFNAFSYSKDCGYTIDSLRKLRDAVIDASGAVRVMGSAYSLSQAGVARGGSVIDTSMLDRFLSLPYPETEEMKRHREMEDAVWKAWMSEYLRNTAWKDDLRGVYEGHQPGKGEYFIHVEAGMKIRDLLKRLEECGLALPTMGSGGGQSVVGALATSSHGGDFNEPLLVDCIEAVLVVNPKGRSVWISGKGLPLPDGIGKLAIPIRKFVGEERLRAASVSVGRMGAIYSVILRVVPKYWLIEANFPQDWSSIKTRLEDAAASPPGSGGIFLEPLTAIRLNKGGSLAKNGLSFVEREFLGRCDYEIPTHLWKWNGRLNIDNAEVAYRPGVLKEDEIRHLKEGHMERLLRRLGISELCTDRTFNPPLKLHHLNIAISLMDPDRCWVTRRWKSSTVLPERETNSDAYRKEQEDKKHVRAAISLAKDILKETSGSDLGTVVTTLIQRVMDSADVEHLAGRPIAARALKIYLKERLNWKDRIKTESGWLGLLEYLAESDITAKLSEEMGLEMQRLSMGAPDYKRTEKLLDRIAGMLKDRYTSHDELFYAIVTLLREVVLSPDIQAIFQLDDRKLASVLSHFLMKGEFSPALRSGLATRMLDQHNYDMDYIVSANSAEFFFDGTKKTYLEFIETIRSLALQNREGLIIGFIGVRFMPEARALLGMQRWPLTVSVEVAEFRRQKSESEFFQAVQHLAKHYTHSQKAPAGLATQSKPQPEAVPHWGQQFVHDDKLLQAAYGDRLDKWKVIAADLEVEFRDKFSTPFSQEKGLEPPSA